MTILTRRFASAAAALIGLVSIALGSFFYFSSDPPPDPAPGHARMLAALDEIRQRGATDHAYQGNSALTGARRSLAELPSNADPLSRISCLVMVGYQELRAGENEKAIEYLRSAYGTLGLVDGPVPPGVQRDVLMKLAVAYLRQGEQQNCIDGHTADSCLFPIRGSGIHKDPTGSRSAIRYLEEQLQVQSDDLEARWLLNLAYMTVGDYPQRVPPSMLIPPASFESVEVGSGSRSRFPRFPDVAAAVGLDLWSLAGGSIVDDFDNDGLLDVVVSDWSPAGQIRYFHHRPDGTFEDWTERAGLTGIYGGLNMVHADYDNDGDPDILVMRGAWLSEGGDHPNSLLRNEGGQRFHDVTFDAGLAEQSYPTQTAAWADFDNDGDLDLYVGNEDFPSQLFENDGRGKFHDIADEAGVVNNRMAKAVVWGDYDADDLPDLYVANLGKPNRLFHNNGDGTFTDVAPKLGVTQPKVAFPAWFWDYNNDGILDLYSSSYELGTSHIAADALGVETTAETDRLYEGDGQGGFRDVTQQRNLAGVTQPMGANFGDIDNDGFLDFYLGTGYPEYEALMPNLLFRNDGGRRFDNVTTDAGMGHLQKGHGVAFADLDNDGDQDVFAEMGGWYPGDAFANALYENPGFGHHWLTVRLVGTESNRSAIGARIRVTVESAGPPEGQSSEASEETAELRSIYRWVNSGGSFGASPLRCEIGLGNARKITELEVYWPTTGRTQKFTDVPLDQFYEVVEGDDRLQPLKAPHTPFAKPAAGEGHRHHHHAGLR